MGLTSIGRVLCIALLFVCSCFGQTSESVLETSYGTFGHTTEVELEGPEQSSDATFRQPIFLVHLACSDIGDISGTLSDMATTLSDNGHYLMIKTPGHPLQTLYTGDKDIVMLLLQRRGNLATSLLDNLVDVSLAVESHSHIFVVTDQPEPEVDSIDIAADIIADKNIQVGFILVDCGTQAVGRQKRAFSSANFYQLIADASGGSVITTTKGNIGSVVDIIKETVTSSPVNIMRFTFSSGPMMKFQIPVDNALTQVTIKAQMATPSIAFVKQPSGIPETFAGADKTRQQLGPTLTVYKMNITKATDYGYWTIQRLDSTEWDVTVTGQSKVDFTHQFLEKGTSGYGEYPIKGRPISGKQLKIVITVPLYDRVKSVDNVLFLDRTNLPLDIQPLTNIGGRRGKSKFYSMVTIPNDDFKIAVEGTDNTTVGNTFRRLDPQTVQPISIKLSVPTNAGTLYANETLNIPFTVSNEGSSAQDLDVKIEDNKGFSQAPDTISVNLKGGANKTGHFVIVGGPTPGDTVTVTITAKPFVPGTIRTGQYEVRRFTVQERKKKPEDKINPTCNITKVTGTCNIGSDLCACVNHTWSMDVEVSDVGFGLREIFPTGVVSNKTFQHDAFKEGELGVVKASVSADCCHQKAAINVVDKAGNIGQCQANITQNFKPPDPKICNNSTTLNVTIPCKNVVKTGKCDFGSNPCDCHTKGWHVSLEFGTVGWNLYQAFTVGAGNNASLQRVNQTVELDMDCCHQDLTINGVDVAGNVGQCHAVLNSTFKTPTPADCTTTTSTTTTTTTTTTSTTTTTTTAATSSNATATPTASATALTNSTAATKTTSKSLSGGTTNKKATKLTTKPAAAGAATTSTTTKPKAAIKNAVTTTAASTKTTTQASSEDESSGDSRYISVPREAVGAAITIAGVAAIGAIVTMAVIFKRSRAKSKTITPHKDRNGRRTPEAW